VLAGNATKARAAARIVNLVNLVNLAPLVAAPAEELRADFHASDIVVHTVCRTGPVSADRQWKR
jgi:hypothetical protein